MSGDLRALAAEYVALQDKVERSRAAMLVALTANGAGDHPVRPTKPARALGGKPQPQPPQSQELQPKPNHLEMAKEAEARILGLLKVRPMRMAEIASEMSARQSTTSERLRRLREKGLVTQANGAWEAVSAAPAPDARGSRRPDRSGRAGASRAVASRLAHQRRRLARDRKEALRTG